MSAFGKILARARKPLRCFLCGLFLALFQLSFHHSVSDLSGKPGLAPPAKVKGKTGKSLGCEDEVLDLSLARMSGDLIPSPHFSFFIFDFKQNLRVWPVVASGIVRSPPLNQSL